MTKSLRSLLLSVAALVCALGLAFTLAAPAPASAVAYTDTDSDSETESDSDTDDDSQSPWSRYSKWARPLVGLHVALDPGHNGGNAASIRELNQQVSDGRGGTQACDTVGNSTDDGYPEHAFTFDVTTRLVERLTSLGATVALTREDDVSIGPCVDIRGRFAEDHDVDLMLSIHANGSTDRSATGYFVVIADPPLSASQASPSRELAEVMVEALAEGGFTPNPEIEDTISARDDLAALNFSRRPTVLLELGEMRNPAEAEVMTSEEGRQAYADAIARGVIEWSAENPARD